MVTARMDVGDMASVLHHHWQMPAQNPKSHFGIEQSEGRREGVKRNLR